MYQLSSVRFSQSFSTMLEVLSVFRSNAFAAGVEAADVSLTFFSHPVPVTRF